MSKTWGQYKTEARGRLFPQGEATSQVPAHDKMFVDAVVDIQKFAECWQLDNSTIVQYCETFFNCGITAFDGPRGNIMRLSVIDKINQTTGKEDATVPDDYCSEVHYLQVDPCYIHKYISTARRGGGCCPDIGGFFAMPACGKRFPPPTDAGLKGLPPLALGFHYAQTDGSTDARYRARQGVWAIERGKIYIAPWIQSTETVIVKWDGIKRTWSDNDLIEEDPTLFQAIENWVLKEHNEKFEHDYEAGDKAHTAYIENRSILMMDCFNENHIRNCTRSKARSSVASMSNLYYNDTPQSFTAQCPSGTNGTPATATVQVGSVASTVSVADANQLAYQQAQSQAQATLNCTDNTAVFVNDTQTYTATCGTESGAPTPEGGNKTVTIPAGSVTSTVSKDAANAAALAQATAAATAQLSCTWFNAPQTFTAVCESDAGNNQTVTTPSGAYSSTTSQADADQKALAAATNQANTQLAGACAGLTEYWNTTQVGVAQKSCSYITFEFHIPPPPIPTIHPCVFAITVTVAAHTFNSTVSQADANAIALSYANAYANNAGNAACASRLCANQNLNYP